MGKNQFMTEINITAPSLEKYQELFDKIRELPEGTLNQIERVDTQLIGVTCYIKQIYSDDTRLFIPRQLCTQIQDFGDYIGIYCKDFFLRAKKEKFNYTYIFI
jgi:hypothetical protein